MTWHTVIRTRKGGFVLAIIDRGNEFEVVGDTTMAERYREQGGGTVTAADPEQRAWQYLNTAGASYLVAETPTQDASVLDTIQGAFDPDQLRDEHGRWATDPSSANSDVAETLIADAAEREPAVTSDMQDVARTLGGRMEGLEFRVKSPESLSRKINDKMREGLTREQAASSIKDALRYTMEFSDEDYTEHTIAALTELEQRGYEIVEIKNYWQPGDTYSGINTVLRDGDTQLELQFHTPESWSTKMGAHEMYQQYRAADAPPDRKRELYDSMAGQWNDVPIPRAIETFGTPVFYGEGG